jgi:hypothetical protein
MKRALVWRATCAIIGTAFSVLACSSSNPTLPSGVDPIDSGRGERGIVHPNGPEAGTLAEAGAIDVGALDTGARDGQDTTDVPLNADAAVGAIDVAPPTKVTVTILDPVAGTVDGGSAVDGGAGSAPVLAKSDRLAPKVRVEVQSMGGDPTLDVVTSVQAVLISTTGKATTATITLNQTDYSVLPESGNKVYIYADTPFDLSNVAGDFYDLQVTAATTGGITGTATIRIYIDGGPIVTILQPSEGTYVKGSVVVTAMVVDNRSSIASVVISIGQYQINPSAVATNGSQYSTTIDFGSFNPPLDGAQIVSITATNGNGNTSIATRKFTIDNTGPTITGTKPATGELIGKIISIEAKIDDPAGVMKDSIIAVVAHGDVHFEVNLVEGAVPGVYQQLFDTTKLPSWAIFPTVSFRAQDVLGNESSLGYLVSLDNTPPMMDLDPPANFQLVRKDGICSWPMDPVGPDAIDDGAVVTQLFDIRARIEDMGNSPQTGSTDFVPIAAVDPATVKLLILDDTSLPLVVDTSDPPDGICDDINPDLVPSVSPQSSKDAQLIGMVPLPANSGAGDYTPLPGSACSGKDANPPNALCDTTYSVAKKQVVTYWPGYAVNLALPSIWTIAPIVNDDLRCAGTQFDASNNLKDGWACIAVQASDKMGNMQVSRPIRVCVVGQPGSTACSAATSGGADIVGVTFPSDVTSPVVVTTKTAVMAGSTAITTGDNLIFSRVTPSPFSGINGTHMVSPADSSGTKFNITNLSERPVVLFLDNLDGKDPVRKGTVGLIGLDGALVSVLTDTPDTVLDPLFAGKVVLMQGTDVPKPLDDRWAVRDIQPTGFNLTASTISLTGMAFSPANLPNCTGTVVKQTSGSKVDATKPCKPWASYPQHELLYLK